TKDVAWMDMRLSTGDQSLHASVGEEGGAEKGDFLVDDAPTPEASTMEKLDGAIQRRWLASAIAKLDAREQTIIRGRHLAEDGATLEELGAKLRISKERVRQLETRAMEKLKTFMAQEAAA